MASTKILILYKKSAYKIYFLERKSSLFRKERSFASGEINGFKKAHDRHYKSLEMIQGVLDRYPIDYHVRARGSKIDFSIYHLVITVGGDGTFLEAARGMKTQLILGVNSDPQSSIGRFCSCMPENFEKIFKKFLEDKVKIKTLERIHLDLKFDRKHDAVEVLNDILICHQNPAAMSRYSLSINGIGEEQRSSGIWISTAAGSSGAIHSAGGKLMEQEAKGIQYKPRELYRWPQRKYRLTGGIVKSIIVTSLMRNGVVFVDGAHFKLPFHFSAKVKILHSRWPLKVIIA